MSIEKSLLHDEIQREIEKLEKMELGSESYKVTTEGVSKLMDRAIEIEKVELESEEKKLKLKQMEDDKKDRKIKNGLTAAGIIIPTVVTIWGTLKSFKFEETGTVTTIMGRGFVNKLLPKK